MFVLLTNIRRQILKKIHLVLAATAAVLAISTAQAQPAPPPAFEHGGHSPDRPRDHKPVTHSEFMQRAEKHFQVLDADKDGAVSPAEIKKFHRTHKRMRDTAHPMPPSSKGEVHPEMPHTGAP
jgi:hypothetical protein